MDEMDTQVVDQDLDLEIPSFDPQDLSLVPILIGKSGARFGQWFFIPKKRSEIIGKTISGSSVVPCLLILLLQLYNHQTKRWGNQRMKHLMMRRLTQCYMLRFE